MEKQTFFAANAFAGKCAIITGGAGDIATAIAIRFARAGIAKIALLDKDGIALDKAIATLKKEGVHAVKIQVDLSSKEKLQVAIKELYQTEGETWDILVTAAGLFIGTSLIDSKLEDLNPRL